MSLKPEEEEALAAIAGVTLESLAGELTAAWWVAYKGLQQSGAWTRHENHEDYQLALDIVTLAVKVRYHVS